MKKQGDFSKRYPVLPGPLEGISGAAFCRTANELDLIPAWITPFWRVTNEVGGRKALNEFVAPFINDDREIIVQLIGVDGRLMGRTAAAFGGMEHVSGINLNFACPSRQVVENQGGGGALKCIPLMRELIERIQQINPDLPLSLKVRSGFFDWHEIENFLPKITVHATIDFVAVHHRSVKEQYAPVYDRHERLDFIAAVAEGAKIPLVFNGDINTLDDVKGIWHEYPEIGIMSARGFLADPYFLRRVEFMILNSYDGKNIPSVKQGKNIFYRKFVECARHDRQTRWHNGRFIEISNYIWGKEQNPVFGILTECSDSWEESIYELDDADDE